MNAVVLLLNVLSKQWIVWAKYEDEPDIVIRFYCGEPKEISHFVHMYNTYGSLLLDHVEYNKDLSL